MVVARRLRVVSAAFHADGSFHLSTCHVPAFFIPYCEPRSQSPGPYNVAGWGLVPAWQTRSFELRGGRVPCHAEASPGSVLLPGALCLV